MPTTKIPRSQIPKFTKSELDRADLCAKALWYGINFETGKDQTSDAYLMEHFATQFYGYHKQKTPLKPPLVEADVRALIKTCRIYILYRGIAGMDFIKGIKAIYNDVYPIYLKIIKKSYSGNPFKDAADCLSALSDGFVRTSGDNRLVLASRILFFLVPDLMAFNIANAVAIHFGLPTRPHYHFREFYQLMGKGLKTNQTLLSRYKLPNDIFGELKESTWNRVKETDWWSRRVMDLAILMKLNLATPCVNLRQILSKRLANET